MNAYWYCLQGIVQREWLRFVLQRSRFFSALVRPLLWLVVFAAGFRAALGIAIIAPYDTYITYETYIVPGLACMILLFNGMQGSLSMVYDREMGSMRVLLTSPLPRAFLLASKLLAIALISLLQVYAFLAIPVASALAGDPELANVPEKYIHAPWTMPAEIQAECGVLIGRDYPMPVVDHAEARQRTLARFKNAAGEST